MLGYRLKWILVTTFIIYISGINTLRASPQIDIKPSEDDIYYITDFNDKFNINNALELPQNKWIRKQDQPNSDLITRPYWLKIELDLSQKQTATERLLFKIDNPFIDDLEVYIAPDAAQITHQVTDTTALLQGAIASHHFIFPIPPQVSERTVIYVKYRGLDASYLTMSIVSSDDYIQQQHGQVILMGGVIGLFLLALLCNTLAYFAARDRRYSYLSGYLIVSLLFITTINGYSSLYLWNGLTWLLNPLIPSIMTLALYFSLQYCDFSLNLREQSNISLPTIKWLSIGLLLISATSLVLPFEVAAAISIVSGIITLMIIVSLLSWLTYKQYPDVQYYLLSWLVLIVGSTSGIAIFYGFVDITIRPQTPLTLAICTQILIFYALLIKKLLINRQRLIDLKNQSMRQLQELKLQADLELQHKEEQQLDLEALVDERTFELNMTLRELQETNRRLKEQSTIDALTGAKNRKFFDSRYQAEQRLSRRQQTPLSLLFLDADKFKLVNDNYGHLAGDHVLIAICHRAKTMLKRPNDYVCRYGGEEFAILLPNTDSAGAAKMAELIRQQIEKTSIKADSHQLNVTVSIGVSTAIIESESEPNALFDLADKALYKAKSLGRNRVTVADDIVSQ